MIYVPSTDLTPVQYGANHVSGTIGIPFNENLIALRTVEFDDVNDATKSRFITSVNAQCTSNAPVNVVAVI